MNFADVHADKAGSSDSKVALSYKARYNLDALKNPDIRHRFTRKASELTEQRSIQHGYNPVGFRDVPGVTPPNNLVAEGEVGTVTVTISDTGNETVNVSGLAATSAVGSVTVVDDAATFDSTSITLDSTSQTFDEG